MRGLRVALAVIWVLGGAAATGYALQKEIPIAIALPVAVAFLVEISFYAGLNKIRWPSPVSLWASALLPFLIYSVPTGVFGWRQAGLLAAITAASVFWLTFRKGLGWDLGYLLFMAALYLGGVPRMPYAQPWPGLRVDALGQLMWFRLGMAAMLHNRPSGHVGFGFFPTAGEWRIGLRYFLLSLPVGAVLMWALGYHVRLADGFWWKTPATFLGILWVVAMAEEFFFRGLLLHRLRDSMNPIPAILASSLLFGAFHISFPGAFPNWKMVSLATVLGVFCGRAYLEAGGIRAAMVTHASVVTVFRTLLA